MGIIEQVKQMKIDAAKDEARLEKDTFFVKNLLSLTDFSDKEIASLAGVTENFVKKFRKAKKK